MKSKLKKKLIAFIKEAIRAAVAAEKIVDDIVRINMGAVSLCPMIGGSFDGEDESLALVAADGLTKVADITVVSTEDGQRIVCTLASAVPAGTYYVRLVSHGLDPTAQLVTALHKVTLKAGAVPPGPEPVGEPAITGVARTGNGHQTGGGRAGIRLLPTFCDIPRWAAAWRTWDGLLTGGRWAAHGLETGGTRTIPPTGGQRASDGRATDGGRGATALPRACD